jgi:hypothetical protein
VTGIHGSAPEKMNRKETQREEKEGTVISLA